MQLVTLTSYVNVKRLRHHLLKEAPGDCTYWRQSEVKFVKVASYCDRQKTASLPNYQQELEAVLAAFDRSDAIHVQSSRV